MAPEQVLDNEVSPRSDIYSLGVLMYELLSGQVPFPGRGATQTMMAQIHQPPPPLEVPGLPPEVVALVMRCLEKEPRRRFNDTAELMVALRELDWPDEPMETNESTMWDVPRPPLDLLGDREDRELTGDTEHSGAFNEVERTIPRIEPMERTEPLGRPGSSEEMRSMEQTQIRQSPIGAIGESTSGYYRRMLMGAMLMNAVLLAFVILLLLTRGI